MYNIKQWYGNAASLNDHKCLAAVRLKESAFDMLE